MSDLQLLNLSENEKNKSLGSLSSKTLLPKCLIGRQASCLRIRRAHHDVSCDDAGIQNMSQCHHYELIPDTPELKSLMRNSRTIYFFLKRSGWLFATLSWTGPTWRSSPLPSRDGKEGGRTAISRCRGETGPFPKGLSIAPRPQQRVLRCRQLFSYILFLISLENYIFLLTFKLACSAFHHSFK